MANLNFTADKIANSDDVKLKMPKVAESDMGNPKAVIIKAGASLDMIDGELYPADSDYQHLGIDNNYSKEINQDGVDVTQSKGHIACRDRDTGNLWTGEPVDGEDCVNYKYANQHYVQIEANTDYHPHVYVQPAQSPYPAVIGADRTDGYMYDTEEGGALSDGNLKEFSHYVARRQSNGNLLSGTPTKKYDVANKAYVDGMVGDIETALDSIIAIQNELIGGDSV